MRIGIFLAFALGMMGYLECNTHKFSVHQKDYRFSTVFEMDGHGSVVKSSLRWLKPLRDSYDVYDESGEWCATGISRIFCLGLFRAWGAEFDVYSKEGDILGVIDGQVLTTGSARYSIYDAKGILVGIAFLDLTHAGISIVHPEKTNRVLARLTRNFVRDQVDHWDVVVYDEAIHPAIIKVFAAFAVDYQEYFKQDF